MAKKFGPNMQNLGLWIMRVGLGAMFVYYGWPKMSGGLEKWAQVGAAVKAVGITFAYPFWGFMAACSEFWGGIFVMLGILFRPACLLITITMTVAVAMHLSQGKGIMPAAHALDLGIVFFSLMLIGPGNMTMGTLMKKFRKRGGDEE